MLATPETDSAPAAIVEAPVAESETIAPTIHAEPQPQQKPAASRLPLIIAAILLLVVIAGALWWFMGRDKGQEVVPAVQAQQAPQPPPLKRRTPSLKPRLAVPHRV